MANKVTKWVKNHKKVIAIGATTIIGGVFVLYKISKRSPSCVKLDYIPNNETELENVIKKNDSVLINLGVGTVTDAWSEANCANLIVNDFKLSDMGKVSEGIKNVIYGADDDTEVSAVLSLYKYDKE